MTIKEAKILASYLVNHSSSCEKCLFNTVSCDGLSCFVGCMFRRLVDEGHLLIDDVKKGGEE